MSGLLSRLMEADVGPRYGPADDFWYEPVNMISSAGMAVTPETALRISAFFACLRVIGETVLSAPLKVYRRLPNGDREEAPEHPLWPILHGGDPNDDQTSEEWRETHVVHTAMRGTSWSKILPGERGPVSHLQYLHPDRVKVDRLASGRLRYQLLDDDGTWKPVSGDSLFRFPGLSSNGVTGLSVLEYARESLGISLALQRYAGRSFSQGVRPSGVLEHPGSLTDKEKIERLRRSWTEVYAGADNSGKTVILEDGMKYHQVGMTNDDAQMLDSEQWQVNDVARWFRMPLIMIQEQEKSTSWGTGVEHQQIGFVVFTMLPWFIRHEKRINKQLIAPLNVGRGARPDEFYCEYTIEALLRGDIKTRYEAYQIAAGGNAPWMNRQEIRRKENLNRGPGELDEFLQPMNMGPAGLESSPRGTLPSGAVAMLPSPVDPRLQTYSRVLATQMVRLETEWLKKAARKHADDAAAWEHEVREFYGGLVEKLGERCQMPPASAGDYSGRWEERLLNEGAQAAEGWESAKIEELQNAMLQADVV